MLPHRGARRRSKKWRSGLAFAGSYGTPNTRQRNASTEAEKKARNRHTERVLPSSGRSQLELTTNAADRLEHVARFDRDFDTTFEDRAAQQRGAFLTAFPRSKLGSLTLDKYVIGKRRPTFCAYVEPNTRLWANIIGATSFKFGIYYGRPKSDATRRYRFVEGKFGANKDRAFAAVKTALLELVNAGKSLDFEKIDQNPLSQMFKAKILSLYFQDKYLNVCAKDHIVDLASEFGVKQNLFVSEQQHLLLREKLSNPLTKDWSNPKFMTLLYNTYIRDEPMHLKGVPTRRPPEIDVDEMLENRKKIGKMSEAFALKWEKERLRGRGYSGLIKGIVDLRNAPANGYDFLSHSEPNQKRFIEVKSAGRNWAGPGFRFFLSEKERAVSLKAGFRDQYYFYLVYYKDGEPNELDEWKASDLYKVSKLSQDGYIVAFEREETD
jgi:Domain of unknown function (DUF3883)